MAVVIPLLFNRGHMRIELTCSYLFLSQPGFQAVTARLLLITHIAFCLHSSFLKLRCQVADVLAAISVLGGSQIVLSALSEFRVAFGETFRFEWLVANLQVNDDEGGGGSTSEGLEGSRGDGEIDEQIWAWRASGFALVNAITTSPGELEERVMLRDEFTRRGLNEVIVVCPEAFLFHYRSFSRIMGYS